MVNVSATVPPLEMAGRENAFAIVGGAATIRVAIAGAPFPALLELIWLVTLLKTPELAAVTFRVIVQEEFAAREPPLNATLPEFAVAVTVPPQVLASALGLATCSPAGKVSVNANPDMVDKFVLLMVKISSEVPPGGIMDGTKDLLKPGGASTVIDAEAVFPAPNSLDETVEVVLFFSPAVVPVTFTVIVHDPLAATPPPERLTDPLVDCAVPPQVFVRIGPAESPLGSVSVNPTPVIAITSGLVIVKVKVVEPPTGMVLAPKALLIIGAVPTRSVALGCWLGGASKEVTAPEVFTYFPALAAVTLTVIEQELLTLPNDSCTDPVVVASVPQLSETVLMSVTPDGKVSVNLTEVNGSAPLGFVIVKVRALTPPGAMLEGLNDLVKVGGPITIRTASG